MKIGIIIHSQTGNTRQVAEKLREKLLSEGNAVELELLPADNSKKPALDDYDALIFGCPVQGASVSPVLAAYLTKVVSLKNKKVACYVTQFFPYPWMGGNRAISQIRKMCELREGTIGKTGIVNWKNSRREEMIKDLVEQLSKL